MAKVKIKDLENEFGDYKLHYRRTSGEKCPDIVVKKAWIQIGDVYVRPDEFVDMLERLKKRPDFEKRDSDKTNIHDFATLQKAKSDLTGTLNSLVSGMKNVNPEEFGIVQDCVEKSIKEIDRVIKKYTLF
jgi:hypothetical protein